MLHLFFVSIGPVVGAKRVNGAIEHILPQCIHIFSASHRRVTLCIRAFFSQYCFVEQKIVRACLHRYVHSITFRLFEERSPLRDGHMANIQPCTCDPGQQDRPLDRLQLRPPGARFVVQGRVCSKAGCHLPASKISDLRILRVYTDQPTKRCGISHTAHQISVCDLRIIRVCKAHEALICHTSQCIQLGQRIHTTWCQPAPKSKIHTCSATFRFKTNPS